MTVLFGTLLVVILVFTFFFAAASRSDQGRIRPLRIQSKRLYGGIVGGYGAILCLATILFYLFPPEQGAERTAVTENEVAEEYAQFYEAINQKDLSLLNPSKIRERWIFETHSDQPQHLRLKADLSDTSLIIVRDAERGSITIDYYVTPLYVFGFEMTDYMPVPRVELAEDTLIMENSSFELKVAKLGQEFTITQFSQTDLEERRFGIPLTALIIHLPDNVTLDGDNEEWIHRFDE